MVRFDSFGSKSNRTTAAGFDPKRRGSAGTAAHRRGRVDLSDADWRLLAYVPLHVVGYRQFLDVVVLRTCARLLRGTGERWESVTSARQREPAAVSATGGPADD